MYGRAPTSSNVCCSVDDNDRCAIHTRAASTAAGARSKAQHLHTCNTHIGELSIPHGVLCEPSGWQQSNMVMMQEMAIVLQLQDKQKNHTLCTCCTSATNTMQTHTLWHLLLVPAKPAHRMLGDQRRLSEQRHNGIRQLCLFHVLHNVMQQLPVGLQLLASTRHSCQAS